MLQTKSAPSLVAVVRGGYDFQQDTYTYEVMKTKYVSECDGSYFGLKLPLNNEYCIKIHQDQANATSIAYFDTCGIQRLIKDHPRDIWDPETGERYITYATVSPNDWIDGANCNVIIDYDTLGFSNFYIEHDTMDHLAIFIYKL